LTNSKSSLNKNFCKKKKKRQKENPSAFYKLRISHFQLSINIPESRQF
jgi:hypothetical protein